MMQNLFSPDSVFMRVMSRIGDLLLLNLLFLLTCIPLITVGAAVTAMYSVTFRFDTDSEASVIRSYLRAFRADWKQSTVIWLVVLLCGGSSCFNMLLFSRLPGIFSFASVLFALLLVLVLLTAGFVFPLLSQFDNPVMVTLKNAFALSLGFLPRAVLIAVVNLLPLIVFLADVYVFFQTAFIWAAIFFAAAAYLNTLLLKPVLARFLEERKLDKC